MAPAASTVLTVLPQLRAIVGDANVITDPSVVSGYTADWTRRFQGTTAAVVRPTDTAQTAAVMTILASQQIPVVPQGGNTGLVGGGVPMGGEVVISTTRMTMRGDVDEISGQVTVGAGVTLTALTEHARGAGFDVGIDFAARDICTVGGLVATNAGGEKVLRYGAVRAQVAGLTAVLPDGTVISRMNGLPKDNTGYDLVGLLAGSEGTLGIITEIRFRLTAQLRERVVVLAGLDSVATAQQMLAGFIAQRPETSSAELFLADGLKLVCDYTKLPPPFKTAYPAYLVLEIADRTDPSERVYATLEELSESIPGIEDIAIGDDSPTRHKLWRYREAHTEAVSAIGVPVKLDVAMPLDSLEAAIDELPGLVNAAHPGARTIIWGHLNEGNLHVNVLGAADNAEVVEEVVLAYVSARGGSISAEHGVGRAKTAYLSMSRSPAEIAAMRAIKAALDPAGLMNPGAIFQ